MPESEGLALSSPGTPIAWPLRAWLAVEVFFGVSAVSAIGLYPENSSTNFAWPIQPVVMAAMLGAFYMTSAPLFLLPFFARHWEMIRIMILPTALFSTVQVAATVLHWDRFSVGTVPFYVWFASYVLPPPIFVGAYWWHQRKALSANTAADESIPTGLHRLLMAFGVGMLITALIVFTVPSMLIPFFPWTLTPLTASSFSAWLAIFGALMLAMARENSRARSRLASPMFFVLLPAVILQLSRYADQVNWGNLTLWLGLLLFATIGFVGLYMARGSWRVALR